MTERIVLKTASHSLAKEIINVTSTDTEPDFFKRQEINLISLLIPYIKRTRTVSSNGEIVRDLRVLLDTLNTPEDLISLPESLTDKDSDIKELWKTDGFLHISEGWEEQDNQRIYTSLLSVKTKLKKF